MSTSQDKFVFVERPSHFGDGVNSKIKIMCLNDSIPLHQELSLPKHSS